MQFCISEQVKLLVGKHRQIELKCELHYVCEGGKITQDLQTCMDGVTVSVNVYYGFLHAGVIEDFVKDEYFICLEALIPNFLFCYPVCLGGVATNGNAKLLTWA